jgi:cellulose synthase operon protein C
MTRYLWPASVVGLAMFGGAALVPGSWEMAFMKLRDRDFAAAERALEEKFLSGARDRGVLIPLSELYVRNGRVDKAIAVLKKYAEAQPGEKDVAERLAVLMKEAQDMPQAAAQLERLAKNNPSAERLRELDRLHDIQENTEGRIAALSRLVRLPDATTQEFFALTGLLAASDRKTEALTTAFNAVKRWPADSPVGLVQTLAALAIDTNRADIVESALLPWAKRQTSTPALAAVASTLIDKAAPDKAIAIVAGSAAAQRHDPAATVLLARLLADRGDKAQALAKLRAVRAQKKLPDDAVALFAGTALALNNTREALGFIRERGTAAFDDAMLLYAASQPPAAITPEWLDWAALDLGKGAPRPLPAARVAIARGDHVAAAKFAAEARATLSSTSALNVAQLFVDLQDIETAKIIYETITIDPTTTPAHELGRAAHIAVAVKDRDRALALTTRLLELNKLPDTLIAHARALSLNGRHDEALTILDTVGSAAAGAELAKIEVFKAAGRLADLRSLLIERLLSADLLEPHRTSYIFALNDAKADASKATAPLAPALAAEITAGTLAEPALEARLALLSRVAPATALPFLKIAAEKDLTRAGFAYVEALKKANAAAELRRFLAHGAQHAKDAKLREGYLYELIKWGGADALPLLAERARTQDEKWFYAYDAALKKHASPVARRDALRAFAIDTGLKPELRKQIAFQILELGDTAAAESIFRNLAADAAPDSDVIRQLAFIWGPRPKPDAMAWLRRRAAASVESQRPAWAAILLNAGDASSAIAMLKDTEGFQAMRVLADAYAETNNAAAMKRLVTSALAKDPDAKTAGHLARAAEALSLNSVASQAHEAAASSDPNAWLAAGRTAFFAGQHSRAQILLERALAHKASARTSFYLAESLWAQRRRAGATPHYETALSALGRSSEDRQMRLIALARLKRHSDANAELAGAKGDDALNAQSVYAGALLDQGDTERAAGALGLNP